SFVRPEGRNITRLTTADKNVHKSQGRLHIGQGQYEMVTAVPSKEFDCKRREDGAYGGGCRTFYRCLTHRGFRVQCRPPYVFNRHNGRCGRRRTASAPCGLRRNCSGKADGMYADVDRRCRFYYSCLSGFFLGHIACSEGD
ncbi:hypothetical protein LSAT2_000253, partial [Lamellibrachia satsuma]